ncbi:MAG TPA: asparagine synthase (glutamine-hydrolyzing), partial [Gammaproteobacteria bacterium]|nr:asparagine synthase (glutamine-hydrolyzing) [Gammaproteobacteria bacterium]
MTIFCCSSGNVTDEMIKGYIENQRHEDDTNMCGIVGYVNYSGARIADSAFARMTHLIAHRGPDGEGVEHLDTAGVSVSLGHRRLSIQDLSPSGAQPMESGDGAVWIAFNGEVYNFREIRSTLEAKGYRFHSGTDTEVILNAYREWDEDCVQQFNGMFAFAIWDRDEQSLFLCRDRLGIKPLYYTIQGPRIIFASEIKSILAAPGVDAAPDWAALHNPWRFQVAPGTGFQNIHKLAPGHCAKYTRQGFSASSWWNILPSETDPGEAEAINRLNELLESAVRLNMVSDVPVGAFLSGGLDSSAITGLAAGMVDRPIDTFTIRFMDKDNAFEAMPDESVYAK